MSTHPNRRQWLQASAAGTGLLWASSAQAQEKKKVKAPFRFCLNTSTIRQPKLTLAKKIDLAAKAGFDGIEPWIREITEHVQGGGTLKDLAKQIKDHGLTVESAIGFASWIVDDPKKRAQGLESAKRDMDLVQQIGGERIATPPVGATRQTDLDLSQAAQRYRELLEVGEKIGVTPQLEVWGFSKSLGKLSEAAHVAVECGHPKACLLPDVYHLYKGGSSFHGLGLLSGQAMHVFHVNDYPADPPREKINDAARVHVGDGTAPIKQILRTLHRIGFRGALSLELFNRTYWKQDPSQVCQTGLAKMKAAVKQALS